MLVLEGECLAYSWQLRLGNELHLTKVLLTRLAWKDDHCAGEAPHGRYCAGLWSTGTQVPVRACQHVRC